MAAHGAEFVRSLESIEEFLITFYGITNQASITQFLLSNDDPAAHRPEFNTKHQRGAVLIEQLDQDEVFIGVHFAQDIAASLQQSPPHREVSNANLDATCVAIEEISHFILLLHRLSQNRSISQLELEWQGEIDKVLVCGRLLTEQSGDPHLQDLLNLFFERGVIFASDTAEHLRYETANKYAHFFWRSIGALAPDNRRLFFDNSFRDYMRDSYRLPLFCKFPFDYRQGQTGIKIK